MRSWFTYIFLSMVACATVLTSCTDVLSEEGFGNCDDRTTVRLTISFGGDDGPMSRDVDSNNGTIPGLDYTTSGQAEINEGDIYALVVDAEGNFLYRIKDLEIKDGPANDDYYTRTLEGTMIQTTQQVKIVLLANLVQDGIITIGTDDDDNKTAVEAIIDGYEGQSITNLYNALIYNYNGTTPWTLTGENARRIPMWGESQPTTVPPTESIVLACYLYRALAKVQIWVNMKDGIDGFVINSITVNNIHTKGYCVSQADFDDDSPHYADTNFKPYADPYPYIPASDETYSYQSVTYNSIPVEDGKTKYISDMIYLPEQFNFDADGKELSNAVIIEVTYNYNGDEDKIGTIHFTEDIIRNHSYIFNINVSNDAEPAMYYEVINWTSVNNGTLTFGGSGGAELTQ